VARGSAIRPANLLRPANRPATPLPQVTRPATTSHSLLTQAQRSELGISEALVRVAVGIEDTGDLLADFAAALDAL
jgi:O-succinylhomoserine sulfhydrylase